MTIGQYLEKHNLEPVRIGFGVKHGGENTIFTNSMDFVLTEDDCMEIYVSAERESTESEFPEEIICMGTAYLEDAKSAADVMKTELHVTLPEESHRKQMLLKLFRCIRNENREVIFLFYKDFTQAGFWF